MPPDAPAAPAGATGPGASPGMVAHREHVLRLPHLRTAVYFYGTCLVDLFYPQAGMAGIELLRREGLEVVFPQGQTCCGQPAFNCGYPEEARAVVRAQLALFREPWPVVVPSGSCAAMMRRHYPELFAGEPELP